MTWRYIVRRALTGQIVHWDVPLVRDELTWTLSGAGYLRASLTPDLGRAVADDGRLLFEEWATMLYAEHGGQLRWGGIVVRSGFDGPTWQVEAAGFTTYLHGIPYLGSYSAVQVDPLTAARHLWSHVQSYPDGRLGVVLDGTVSPVRLGVAGVAAYDEVHIDGVWRRKSSVPAAEVDPAAAAKLKAGIDSNDTTLTLAAIDRFNLAELPFLATIGNETVQVRGRDGTRLTGLVRGYGASSSSGHDKGTTVKYAGTPSRTIAAVPAEPYQLVWWEAPDCGTEFDQLARETPFDYAEQVAWAGTGNGIEHRVRLGYPRLGRRRTDLAFVQGDNIVAVVTAAYEGENHANEVVGIGAGEGSAALQQRIPGPDGKLRRPYVFTDKSITTTARLNALARAQLAARAQVLEFAQIEVVDHPHAPLGSWELGDDILVRAVLPWLGEVAVWERITGWTLIGEARARLRLQRSDSYVYGSG